MYWETFYGIIILAPVAWCLIFCYYSTANRAKINPTGAREQKLVRSKTSKCLFLSLFFLVFSLSFFIFWSLSMLFCHSFEGACPWTWWYFEVNLFLTYSRNYISRYSWKGATATNFADRIPAKKNIKKSQKEFDRKTQYVCTENVKTSPNHGPSASNFADRTCAQERSLEPKVLDLLLRLSNQSVTNSWSC